jgi:hypothetical protein
MKRQENSVDELTKEKRENGKLDMTLEKKKENYIKGKKRRQPGGSTCGNKVRYR